MNAERECHGVLQSRRAPRIRAIHGFIPSRKVCGFP